MLCMLLYICYVYFRMNDAQCWAPAPASSIWTHLHSAKFKLQLSRAIFKGKNQPCQQLHSHWLSHSMCLKWNNCFSAFIFIFASHILCSWILMAILLICLFFRLTHESLTILALLKPYFKSQRMNKPNTQKILYLCILFIVAVVWVLNSFTI